MRRVILAALAAAVIICAWSSPASAEWGTGCNEYSNHCYGLADWTMGPPGEQVLGMTSWMFTEQMNVGEWWRSAFVDDEEWFAQPSIGYWAESGQESGWGAGGHDCCSLRWFYAYKDVHGYGAYESPYVLPPSPPNQYLIKLSGASACFEVDSNPVGCVAGGFLSASKEVQVGMEAAQEGEPTNWGHDETAVEWTDQTWHHWNSATYKAMNYAKQYTAHVCVGQNGYPYAGWAAWGTC